MAKTAAISRDEWLVALGDAAAPPEPNAVTIEELSQRYGLSRRAMGERVKGLVAVGKARRTVTVRAGRRLHGYVLTAGA